jgi:hypothetical protein
MAVLLGVILMCAGWAYAHVLLLARVLRMTRLSWAWRALALVPVATPLIGLRNGLRTLPFAWLVCGLGYCALRLLA